MVKTIEKVVTFFVVIILINLLDRSYRTQSSRHSTRSAILSITHGPDYSILPAPTSARIAITTGRGTTDGQGAEINSSINPD
jgi:hypothetical protein